MGEGGGVKNRCADGSIDELRDCDRDKSGRGVKIQVFCTLH